MKQCFQKWHPAGKSRVMVEKVNEILALYESQGYVLTLRQLYYQLVSRDVIPNSIQSYKRLGHVVNMGRLGGLIDWRMIEDRIRIPKSRSHWESPAEVIDSAQSSYYRSRWDDQDHYIEVWCEKDAVSNILTPVCSEYDVVFMANRGYSSQSAMYDSSKRIASAMAEGKSVSVIYMGDHDPSGIDMTRDIRERLGMFLREAGEVSFVTRAALNMDQVRKYNPPENPAKTSDSRFRSYVRKFGSSSWELDALEPKVLAGITKDLITMHIDEEKWTEVEELERSHKYLIGEKAEQLRAEMEE